MSGHSHGVGGHTSGLSTGHAGGRHRWRLRAALAVIATFFVVEVVGAVVTGSLALLTDAAHMAGDVVTLAAALLATRIATTSVRGGHRTYGSYRAEVFAAGFAVLVMLGMATFVVVEAVRRIGTDAEVAALPMLVVGAIGLAANLVALVLLRGGSGESINVRGAYLEVVADTVGSIGVIAAAVLVATTGSAVWDTVVALAIGAFIVVRALTLGRDVLRILGQHSPTGVDPDAVAADLEAIDGIVDVHDLHLWTLTSGMNVATAHLVAVGDSHAVLDAARDVLRDRWHIEHATLQVEPRDHEGCDAVDW